MHLGIVTFQRPEPSCPHYIFGFQWYSYQETEFCWFYAAEINPQAANGVLQYLTVFKHKAHVSFPRTSDCLSLTVIRCNTEDILPQ